MYCALPLGPMIAATPLPWNFSSVRSQNDLNSRILILFSFSNVNSLETVASCSSQRLACSAAAAGVYQEGYPPALDAFCVPHKGLLERHPHPKLGRVGTKLSYCNGEIAAGSSNITLYMVWA